MFAKLRNILHYPHFYKITFALLMLTQLALVTLFPAPEIDSQKKVMDDFKQVETEWQEKVKNQDVLKEYFKKSPGQAIAFNLFTLLMIVSFGVGFYFDVNVFMKPQRLDHYIGPPQLPTLHWPLEVLFKVMVWWVLSSIVIGLSLSLLNRFDVIALNHNSYALAQTTIMDLLIVYLIGRFVRVFGGRWADIGLTLRQNQIWKDIRSGILGYVMILPLFFAVLLLAVWVSKLFAYEPPPHPLVGVFLEEEKRAPWLVMYSIFLANVIGPIIEEIFFRGFCYPVLKNTFGMTLGMVITSAFFALIHQNAFSFVPIFVLGMGLVILYERSGNLIAPITMHVFHNCFFISYFFIAKKVMTSI